MIKKHHLFIKNIFPAVIVLALFAFCSLTSAYSEIREGTTHEMMGELGPTLEETLKAELKIVETYKERLKRIETEKIYLAAAVNGYQLQLSTYGNLLLSTGVDLSILQKNRTELKSSMLEIQKMVDEISQISDTLNSDRSKIEQQKQLLKKQFEELTKIKSNKKSSETIQKFQKTAKQLDSALKEKESLILKLDQIYKNRLETLVEISKTFSSLEIEFNNSIEQLKERNLFERNKEILKFDTLQVLKDEINSGLQRALLISKAEFWLKGGQKLWQSAGFVLISFVAVMAGILIVLIRIRSFFSVIHDLEFVKKLGRWHILTTRLLALSVIPGGISLTIFLYSRLDKLYLISPALEMISILILVFIIVEWANCLFLNSKEDPSTEMINLRIVTGFFQGTAGFFFIYILIYYAIGRDLGLLSAFRMAGSVTLLAWTLISLRGINFKNFNAKLDSEDRKEVVLALGGKYLLIVIGGTALVLDMIGYGSLCIHWIVSWAKSGVIIFWWFIFFKLIQEWDLFYKEKSRNERNVLLYDDYPVQWLMIRMGQLTWIVSLIVLFLLAWGSRQSILGSLYQKLAHPVTIGNMKFSLMGLFYAALVLLITFALARIWKWLFQSKFLSQSGMEIGLQDSITTITTYVLWMFGILISLHVFGLNTASLAVAFGALGIGLGFGLQNIFNNFISGIILLVERPIQVGDDVEINSTWATVKKINVRSTVVQTYDNASLIIPNADFISNSVTNWSFKDKRIRRSIDVGVAYGSDVELVRNTLLEIAGDTTKVLHYPMPDVLFKDFGDSALIFRLRIWTDIDNMLKVETEIRFKIDRLFRERGIEISFPQQDIHIRSVTDSLFHNTKKERQPGKNE